jgi:hypothetical protein
METHRDVEVSFHALETSAVDGGGQQYAPATLPPGKDPSVSVRITREATTTVGLFSTVRVEHSHVKTEQCNSSTAPARTD